MTDYTGKARGFWVNGDKLVDSLVGYDFLIAKYGSQFHNNVQKAYDANIPCILFYENNPLQFIQAGLDKSKWLDSANEDLQNIIAAVGARAIHGVMIDCSMHIEDNGNLLAVNWLTQTGQHLLDRVWANLKYPKSLVRGTYLYMGYKVPLAYTEIDRETINMFILANANISTTYKATSFNGVYPTSDPTLPYNDSSKCPWYFWLYKVMTNGYDVLYRQNKTQLYEDLGFVASTVVVEDPIVEDPEEEDPITPPVTSNMLEAINAAIVELAGIRKALEERNNWEIKREIS
jgi:hypothetical protein